MFQSRFYDKPDFFIVTNDLITAAIHDLNFDPALLRPSLKPPGQIELWGFRITVLYEEKDLVIPIKRGEIDSDFNAEIQEETS